MGHAVHLGFHGGVVAKREGKWNIERALVDRTSGDHAFDAACNGCKAFDIGDACHTARCDHRVAEDLRKVHVGVHIEASLHAVFTDIGIDQMLESEVAHLGDERFCSHAAATHPAID